MSACVVQRDVPKAFWGMCGFRDARELKRGNGAERNSRLLKYQAEGEPLSFKTRIWAKDTSEVGLVLYPCLCLCLSPWREAPSVNDPLLVELGGACPLLAVQRW